MKPLNQQLFDKIFVTSKDLGYDTYHVRPKKEVPYPFVNPGEIQIIPRKTSSHLIGKAHATVHVWGLLRTDVAEMVENLMLHTSSFRLNTRILRQVKNASSDRILEDDSTPAQLWHGVILLEFNILTK